MPFTWVLLPSELSQQEDLYFPGRTAPAPAFHSHAAQEDWSLTAAPHVWSGWQPTVGFTWPWIIMPVFPNPIRPQRMKPWHHQGCPEDCAGDPQNGFQKCFEHWHHIWNKWTVSYEKNSSPLGWKVSLQRKRQAPYLDLVCLILWDWCLWLEMDFMPCGVYSVYNGCVFHRAVKVHIKPERLSLTWVLWVPL